MTERPNSLEFIYVSSAAIAQSLHVLPDTMYERKIAGGIRQTPRSIQRWWSPGFRSQLYSDLDSLLAPPALPDHRNWTAEEALRVAGIGLLSSSREEIGFGLDLVSAVEDSCPEQVRLIVDGSKGVRFVEAFRNAGRGFTDGSFRLYLAYQATRRTGVFLVRVPLGLATFMARTVSRWLARKRRHPRQSSGNGRPLRRGFPPTSCDVAIFEATSKGWEFSQPILDELRLRGAAVVEASPQSGAVVTSRSGEPSELELGSVPLKLLPLNRIRRAVSDLIPGQSGALICSPRHRRVVTEIISRRARAYFPGMGVAAALARVAVEELGVSVTLQEDHISPSGRAFLLESQRLGAHTVTAHHGVFDPLAPERKYFVSPETILEWGYFHAPFPSTATVSRIVGNHLVEERMSDVMLRRETNPRDPIVLVAFGRPSRIVDPDFFASAIRLVADAAEDSPVPFVVNLHPGDSRSFWDTALRTLDNPQLTYSRDLIYQLMPRAVALVTNHSTAGAEAVLADIPVVCVARHQDPRSGAIWEPSVVPSYLSEGAAYSVDSAKVLAGLVGELLSKDGSDTLAAKRVAYARRFLDRSSERSSHMRTADLILELTHSF